MEFTKKSAFINKYGNCDIIQIGPLPLQPLNDKIEVQVKICGMNFADIYLREGLLPHTFPFVLGIECTGLITEVGPNAKTDLIVGTRVICYDVNGGLYSDRIRIDPRRCYALPDYISYETGAAIFVNYLTAYFALYGIGNLNCHEDVFVKSCAGGVGSAVTQLAKLKTGVKVYGTASEGKETFAKENGVDYVFSYENFEKDCDSRCPDGFDVIIENEAGASYKNMSQRLKPLGRLVSLGANDLIGNNERLSYCKMLKFFYWDVKAIDRQAMMMKSQIVGGLHLGNLCEQTPNKIELALSNIFNLIKEGKIDPKVDSVWSLESIKLATELLINRKNKGKVLLKIDS